MKKATKFTAICENYLDDEEFLTFTVMMDGETIYSGYGECRYDQIFKDADEVHVRPVDVPEDVWEVIVREMDLAQDGLWELLAQDPGSEVEFEIVDGKIVVL